MFSPHFPQKNQRQKTHFCRLKHIPFVRDYIRITDPYIYIKEVPYYEKETKKRAEPLGVYSETDE